MAMNVKFKRGLSSNLPAAAAREADTLYFCTDGKLYLGANLIADVTVLDTNTVNSLVAEALKNFYTKTEIDAIIQGLDASIKGEGTYVDVTVVETDGKITGVTVDDAAIDTKLAGYKTVQTAVVDPTKNGSTLEFIDTISQNTNGVITATKKSVDLSAYSTTEHMNGAISTAIQGLDAEKSSTAVEAGKGVQVTVKEVDGKIDTVTVSGNYDNAYDAKGAAAAVLGNSSDAVTANTVYGAKAAAAAAQNDATIAKTKIETFLGTVTPDGSQDIIDTLAEINSYVGEHGEEFAALSERVTKVENGTTVVEKAKADKDGNEISTTYAKTSSLGYLAGKNDSELNLKELAHKDTVATADIDDNAVTTDKLADAINTDIAKGVEAHGWGNHADAGYADGKTVNDDILELETNKADKLKNYTTGNFVSVDANGNIADSSYRPGSFATAEQGAKADSAVQYDENGNLNTDGDVNVKGGIYVNESTYYGATTLSFNNPDNYNAPKTIELAKVVQTGDLGDLAKKSIVETTDIKAKAVTVAKLADDVIAKINDAAKAVQGDTTTTIKGLEDTVSANAQTCQSNFNTIVEQLTWGSF